MNKWDEFLDNPENLKFPFVDLLREQMEVIGENPHGLLIWQRGRTTLELDIDGIRVGVCLHRFGPIDFGFCAQDLTRCGMPCNARQVRRWFGKLERQGKVAGLRTGRGYVMLVMYSHKKWKPGEENIRKLKPSEYRIRDAVLKAAAMRSVPACDPAEIPDSQQTAVEGRAAETDAVVAIRPPRHGDLKGINKRINNKHQQFAFSTPRLQITMEKHESFCAAFPNVDLQDEYRSMDAWLLAKGRRLANPAMFAFRWLKKIPVESGQQPSGISEADVDPGLLALLRGKTQDVRAINDG